MKPWVTPTVQRFEKELKSVDGKNGIGMVSLQIKHHSAAKASGERSFRPEGELVILSSTDKPRRVRDEEGRSI